jgi:hypothetical protein
MSRNTLSKPAAIRTKKEHIMSNEIRRCMGGRLHGIRSSDCRTGTYPGVGTG